MSQDRGQCNASGCWLVADLCWQSNQGNNPSVIRIFSIRLIHIKPAADCLFIVGAKFKQQKRRGHHFMTEYLPGSANWRKHGPPMPDDAPVDGAEQIERAALDILNGRTCQIREVATPPFVMLSPGEVDLPEQRLQFLYRYWKNLPKVEHLPDYRRIDPADLRPALGYLMILEPIGDGTDFRYRLYGTAISDSAGRDWTGWTVGEMCKRTGSCYGEFYRAVYLVALLSRQPIYTEHYSPGYLAAIAWRRLVLPFQDCDGKVERLLVGNIPIGQRMLCAAQLERKKSVLG